MSIFFGIITIYNYKRGQCAEYCIHNAMIKSMTGYGRAEELFENYKITVEVKSVNNRYLDYNVKLYRQYAFLEETVRECVSTVLSRGKVDVFIQFDTAGSDDTVITLNEDIARGYLNSLSEMSEKLGVDNNVTSTSLARFPDVITVDKKEQDKEQITADCKKVLMSALYDLTDNRRREGERLKKFFDACIDDVKGILEIIKERSPETVAEYKERMKERISEILDGVEVDEARLLTEVGIFADKVNISEEIIRFESHLKEYAHLLGSDVPVGRKLDFVIQELNREANTMGSKCNDFIIGKAVVDLKSEIEKLREQVQNIE